MNKLLGLQEMTAVV